MRRTMLGKDVVIYALLDSELNVRYVGATCIGINNRLRQHIRAARAGCNSHVYRWLRKVQLDVTIKEIDFVSKESDWESAERKWIKHFNELGCKLTNMTKGGEGGMANKQSEEQRLKH